jgi:hypothetical protein
MANWGHADIDQFALRHGLENVAVGYSRMNKANAAGRHLIQNPETQNEDGENIADSVVGAVVEDSMRHCYDGYPQAFHVRLFRERYADLHRGLERDGFSVDGGQLRRTLPAVLDLPRADDDVHRLLDHYGFAVSRGHLDQGIAAHSRGEWAGANAQFRVYIESLLDSIAERIANGAPLPPPGDERRRWLANTNPPFLSTDLNEWAGQGTGFIQGFFRRLHPAGAHPGLSDEEDSTFRLHLVLLVSRLLLRRIG